MKAKLMTLVIASTALSALPRAALCQGPPPDPARRKAMIAKYDTDGDGHLSPAEMAAAHPGQKPGGPRPRMDRGRTDEGTGTAEKSDLRNDTRIQALLEKFDADGNGTLSNAEMDALRKAQQAQGARP